MPVQIDEVTAEVEPAPAAPSTSASPGAPAASPEVEMRKQGDFRDRLEARADRVCAD